MLRLSEYSNFDGLGLAALVRRREISRRELAETGLRAIQAANPALNAIIEVYDQAGIAAAHAQDEAGLFAGVPFLLKDIGSHDANVKFELGSRLAQGMKAPPLASELVKRFHSSGVTDICFQLAAQSALPNGFSPALQRFINDRP